MNNFEKWNIQKQNINFSKVNFQLVQNNLLELIVTPPQEEGGAHDGDL